MLSNYMKKFLYKRLRETVDIGQMQYGFMPGRWTADAMLVLKRLTEKFRSKGKKLFYVFIDLAFSRVRKVTFFL